MVQLDDLRGRKVAGRLGREALHQHRADGEVGRHDHVGLVLLVLQERTDLVQLGGADAGRSHDDVHAVVDGPSDVVHHDVGTGEVHRHLGLGLQQGIDPVRERDVHLGAPDHRAEWLAVE